VCEARDGAEALALLAAAEEPWMVLLDLLMAPVSGEEVLAQVPGNAQLARHAFCGHPTLTACQAAGPRRPGGS
jgi:CheY-like chemotaxis protein